MIPDPTGYAFQLFWVLNWFNAFEGFILNDKTKKVVKAFDLGMISSDF